MTIRLSPEDIIRLLLMPCGDVKREEGVFEYLIDLTIPVGGRDLLGEGLLQSNRISSELKIHTPSTNPLGSFHIFINLHEVRNAKHQRDQDHLQRAMPRWSSNGF